MLSTEQINLHLLLNKLKRLELLKKCKERNKNKTESLETKINNEVLELIDEKYIDNFLMNQYIIVLYVIKNNLIHQ